MKRRCRGLNGMKNLPVVDLIKKMYEKEEIEEKKNVAHEIFEMVFGDVPKTINIEQGKVIAKKTMKPEEFKQKYGEEVLKTLIDIVRHNEGEVIIGIITLFVEVSDIPPDVVDVINVDDVVYDRECDDVDIGFDCIGYIVTGNHGVEWGVRVHFGKE